MSFRKQFFATVLLTCLPLAAMQSANGLAGGLLDSIAKSIAEKKEITETSFNDAISRVRNRFLGAWVSEKLSNTLKCYIGQNLSLTEWERIVRQAYQGLIKEGGYGLQLVHPVNQIVGTMLWAIPLE